MTPSEPTVGREAETTGATADADAPTADGEAAISERDDSAADDKAKRGDDESAAPTPVPRRDAAESAAAFFLPVLAGAVWAAASGGGPGAILATAFAGGGVGWVLARLRLRFESVRTAGGIERRRRPDDADWAAQVTEWEYDPRYDRLLAAALALVGVAAFAAVALVEASDGVLLRLVVVGHLGLVTALLVYGVSDRE